MDDSSRLSQMDGTLRLEYDEAKAQNKLLMDQLDKAQTKYMEKAEDRLGVQAALVKILNMINSSDKKKWIDKSYDIAEKCEAKSKERMSKLEAEWTNITKSSRENVEPRSEVEDKLGKYKDKNKQIEMDLENRAAYFEAEEIVMADYMKAVDDVEKWMKDKCYDKALVGRIEKAAANARLMM